MVDDDPERALALSYAMRGKAALSALFALDDRLADVLRTTHEPLIGQMRLTWWREALDGLDEAPPPAEPVLQALAREVLPAGVSGASLAAMIDGWEALIDSETLTVDILRRHAGRGGSLFTAAATALGCVDDDPVEAAGEGWALVDLGWHLQDPEAARESWSLAKPLLAVATASRWSRAGRPLGALAHLARLDIEQPRERRRQGAPRRVLRLAWHRLTGR